MKSMTFISWHTPAYSHAMFPSATPLSLRYTLKTASVVVIFCFFPKVPVVTIWLVLIVLFLEYTNQIEWMSIHRRILCEIRVRQFTFTGLLGSIEEVLHRNEDGPVPVVTMVTRLIGCPTPVGISDLSGSYSSAPVPCFLMISPSARVSRRS